MDMTASPVLTREPQSITTIRFQDCDPFGHLNNARYIDYFLNARNDHLLAAYNFDLFAHTSSSNAGWVVTKTQIAYLVPAKPNEQVLIKTRLLHATETVLLVEGQMSDSSMKRLKSLIWMEFMYVSLATGRPQKHEETLMELFHRVIFPDESTMHGFDHRVESARQAYRRPQG